MDKVLLIADDNKDIVDILKIYAQKEGYKTVCAYDGEQALKMQKEYNPVLILLDVMMPKINGYDVCRQIRQTSNVPIIMVTAKSEEADRILGLDIGADDYVVKPFSPREVMTRIKAVLRRVSDEANDERNKRIEVAGLTIDMNSYEAYVNGKPVVLTKKEIEILWLFATIFLKISGATSISEIREPLIRISNVSVQNSISTRPSASTSRPFGA